MSFDNAASNILKLKPGDRVSVRIGASAVATGTVVAGTNTPRAKGERAVVSVLFDGCDAPDSVPVYRLERLPPAKTAAHPLLRPLFGRGGA